jgi:hypothetical protein
MRALKISLCFCIFVLLRASPAHAQIASLGKGWILDGGGSITSAPGEVISGKNSITAIGVSVYPLASYFLQSDPTYIRFLPNQSYTMTWSYRIVTASEGGFGYGFQSREGNGVGDFGPDAVLRGAAGSSGTVSTTLTLRNHPDYHLFFSIGGAGSIVIDDVRITDAGGQLVASENAEGPLLASGPLDFQVTDAIALLTPAQAYAFAAAARDLDGDGYPETILTLSAPRPSTTPLEPLVIEASGRMRLATAEFFPAGAPTVKNPPGILFADINNDGLTDILFADAGSDAPPFPGSRIGVALNVGGGRYRDVSSLIPADQQLTRSYAIAAGDIFGDGRVEIILPDQNRGANTALLRWNGNGFDEIRDWIPQSIWSGPPANLDFQSSMSLADFDRDGRLDLLVGGQQINPNFQIVFGGPGGFTAGTVVVLPEGPFGHTEPPQPDGTLTTAEVGPSVVADFNNDGLPDIFATLYSITLFTNGCPTANPCNFVIGDETYAVRLNQGARRFVDASPAPFVNLGHVAYYNLIAVDINNDGFLDVVGTYTTDPPIGSASPRWGTTLFLNDGTGAFQVVDGAQFIGTTTTPPNGNLWGLGSFVPTIVRPGRTEGIVWETTGGCGAATGGCPAAGLNLYKVVANGALGTGPNFVDPATLGVPGFNEFYYLRHYPDAAAAVQAGQYSSGLAHYQAVGASKGYLPHAPNGIIRTTQAPLSLNSTQGATMTTPGSSSQVSTGYATATVNTTGTTPFATAVFSLTQNGVVVSEAGVPASPLVQNARLFIDYRTGVPSGSGTINIDTGLAIANPGSSAASLTFVLRDGNGLTVATGHGSLPPNGHVAQFIEQLQDVAPDFNLPANFSSAILFGSLDISSDQRLSIVGLRVTTNQRGETLLTSTSLADLSKTATASPLYFPQITDGGGYATTIALSNTSGATETGTLSILDDNGNALAVSQAGNTASSFAYSIPSGGVFVFQTDGSSAVAQTGWVKIVPSAGTLAPAGSGVLSFSPGGIPVTVTGVPSVLPTLHARVYVDRSGGHDTGIAIANPNNTPISVTLQTYGGGFLAGNNTSTLNIAGNGHQAEFVEQVVGGIPNGFTGVADISSTTPFVPLTLRTLTNGRGDFLLTTFPAPDITTQAPTPIVFPQIADGGGFTTEFIFISAGSAATTNVNLISSSGTALAATAGRN